MLIEKNQKNEIFVLNIIFLPIFNTKIQKEGGFESQLHFSKIL